MIRYGAIACGLLIASSALAGIDVRVRGLGSDEAGNVYRQIELLAYAIKLDAEHGRYDPAEVQRLFKQGEQDIRTALQPFGWYNPRIASELRGQAPDWTALYTVDAGPQTEISKLDLAVEGEGQDDAAVQRVLRHPRLRIGERLKHADYEELKTRLQQAALAGGYLDASFTRHELRVDPAANRAEILLTLDTGPRWYFGDIRFDQDAGLDEAFLRRYLTIHPGAPFDTAELLASQFAVTDLDYFSSVEFETRRGEAGPDRRIPVVLHAKAKKPYQLRFGAGYGTDTGARGLIGLEFRRLNASGHKLRIDLRPSEHISTAIAEYKIPYGSHPGDSLSFPVQYLDQDFAGVREKLHSVGASYNRQIGAWQRRWYLTYSNDHYTLEGEAPAASTLLMPGLALSRTEQNDPILPRRGWSVWGDLHGGSKLALSDTNFIEGLLRLRGVLPLPRRGRLLARVEEGAALVSRFDTLPPSQRFFAGGDESVRGYAYRSLGPRDAAGHVQGGKFLTTGGLEAEWPVYKNYGVAFFADAGGADDVPNVLLHYGAGLGLRYRAPFGSIGIDLAHPFDRDAPPVRLHLTVRVGL